MFLWACNRRCCHMGFYHSQSHLYDIRSFFLSLPIFFLISISFYTILYTLWFKSWISWHLKNEPKVLSTLFETYFLYTNKENPIQLYLEPTSNRESDFLLFITIRKWSGRVLEKREDFAGDRCFLLFYCWNRAGSKQGFSWFIEYEITQLTYLEWKMTFFHLVLVELMRVQVCWCKYGRILWKWHIHNQPKPTGEGNGRNVEMHGFYCSEIYSV